MDIFTCKLASEVVPKACAKVRTRFWWLYVAKSAIFCFPAAFLELFIELDGFELAAQGSLEDSGTDPGVGDDAQPEDLQVAG